MVSRPFKLVVELLIILVSTCHATRHSFITKHDSRFLIGPIGHPFGFLKGGFYNLTVFDYSMSSKGGEDVSDIHAGFLLKRYTTEKDFSKHQNEILEGDGKSCVFKNFIDPSATRKGNEDDKFVAAGGGIVNMDGDGIFLSMKNKDKTWSPNTPSVSHEITAGEEGLYFLVYQVCLVENGKDEEPTKSRDIRSTFELDVSHINYDSFGNASYLTGGEMPLPTMYFFFSFSYFLLLMMWVANIRNIVTGGEGLKTTKSSIEGSTDSRGGKPTVYSIHYLMAILLGLKAITVFSESIRYHYIRTFGHAEIWSIIYYFFAFLKGIFLFTVILLLGSGWSFMKSFLNEREKKVIFVVLLLQVIDNIAVVVLSTETEGERLYENWTAVLHLVDIICCCAVLFPVVWQINRLEQQISTETEDDQDETDEISPEDAKMIEKLKLFRSFYLLVIGYIYFTRIVVFIFATFLGYRHTWLRYLVTELGTLSFYLVVGMKFRPMVENPYLAVKRDSDDDTSVNQKKNPSSLELGMVQKT